MIASICRSVSEDVELSTTNVAEDVDRWPASSAGPFAVLYGQKSGRTA